MLESRRRGAAPDASTILCVGDSYTFGVYYRPEESYPGRLEQILRAGDSSADGAARWLCENGGVPAQNLAQVAAKLPAQLARLKPKAVVVLGGFNDRWNFGGLADQGRVRGFFEGLILVRIARLVLLSPADDAPRLDGKTRIAEFGGTHVEVANVDGSAAIEVSKAAKEGELDAAAHEAEVTGRLRAIVATIQAAGALPILCTYPSPEKSYEAPSRAAVTIAAEANVPLVDIRSAFAKELTKLAYAELLIPGDKHPTDRGYWRMACLVARELAARGVWKPTPELSAALASAPQHDFAIANLPEILNPITLKIADGKTLAMHGPPGAHFRIVLSGADEPAQKFGRRELKLAFDDCFKRSVEEERLSSSFDSQGLATITLDARELEGARFVALVVLHDILVSSNDLMIRGIAGPMKLR